VRETIRRPSPATTNTVKVVGSGTGASLIGGNDEGDDPVVWVTQLKELVSIRS
jgi:hypothetical protein